MTTKHVVVLPYDEQWRQDFQTIKAELTNTLGQLTIGIEHVGSTSVEGMSAKPIIDIDVIIKERTVLDEVISRLENIGYRYEGNLGIEGREAFKYEGKKDLQRHHLYVCAQDCPELKRHIAFRDYLRSHPQAVKEYGEIKEKGARLYPNDIDKYMEYKSGVIERIYEMAKIK